MGQSKITLKWYCAVESHLRFTNTFTNELSGLDKDLDKWVIYPLLFNLMSILLRT